jgi:hypothetical protein
MSRQLETISAENASFFEQHALLTPIVNNKRKLSRSTIFPGSNRAASSSSTASISPESFYAGDSITHDLDELEIPAHLKSPEAYVFMGLTEDIASILWTRYLNQAAELGADFMDFAKWHIEDSKTVDATTGADDWDAGLTALGVNSTLKKAIMTEGMDDIRCTATCKYWVLESLELNYEALQSLNERLRLTATTLQHQKKVP